jgi:hypothetical protein
MSIATLEELLKDVSQDDAQGSPAVPTLFEAIYRYPAVFGYDELDEDARSAFLLSLYPRLPRLIKSYNPERSHFSAYVAMAVKLYVKSWKRQAAKERATRDSLLYCYHCESGFRSGLTAAEQEPEYGPTIMLNLRPSKHYADMLLVVALKCAVHLSDPQIAAIAHAAGVSPRIVCSYVADIKQKLTPKIMLRQQLVESRNRAWFYKAKYRLELERLLPGTGQYSIVEKQYAYQARILEIKNYLLKEKLLLVPPNTYIAGILHIPARHVTRLWAEAKQGRLQDILEKSPMPLTDEDDTPGHVPRRLL